MEPSSTKVYLVHSKDLNSSNSYYSQRPDLTTSSRKLSKMTGCLEIIDGEDSGQSKTSWDSPNYSRPSSATGARPWSRGSIGCCPPRTDSSMSRRMSTPTKQISLQAVRRKEESTEPFFDQVDWQSLALEDKRTIRDSETNTGYYELTNQLAQPDDFRLEAVVETSWQVTEQLLLEPRKMADKTTSQAGQFSENSIVETAPESGISSGEKTIDEKNSDDSDDDDDADDSDSSEEEEEKLRAPNELLMEFVDCLMRKDYQTASKLCKMILLYEPENPEALKFQPLIEEKLVLDAEAEKVAAEESSDNDDSDDESENEDDDSSDDSEDDDGDSCSDADSSDEDNDDDDGDCGNNESGSNINNNNCSSRSEQSCYHRYLN